MASGPVPVGASRGLWHRRADGRAVLVTWHPSALLRLPPGQQASAFAQFTQDISLALRGPPA